MVCRLLEMRTGSAYSHFVHCADVCSCVVVLFLMHVVIYVCRRQYLTVSLCSVHSSGVKCYVLYLFVFFFTRLGHPKFPFVWFGMRKLCGTDRRRGRQLFDIEPFGIVIFFFFNLIFIFWVILMRQGRHVYCYSWAHHFHIIFFPDTKSMS